MQSLHLRLTSFFEQSSVCLLPWRKPIFAIFILVTAFLCYGMVTRFSMDMSLESWFEDDAPAKIALNKFRKQFGSDDGIYMVYQPADGDVFSEKSLSTLRDLHQALDNARIANHQAAKDNPIGLLRRMERIDSLYNARYQIAQGDTLIAQKLLAENYPQNQTQREHKRQIAQSQRSFELAYFAKDFAYGGIRIKTDFGVVPVDNAAIDTQGTTAPNLLAEDDLMMEDTLTVDTSIEVADVKYQDMQMDEYLDFMVALKSITEADKYKHFTFYYSGNAPMMEFAMESMGQATVLLGLMVSIVVGLLWFLFYSFSAVVWPTVVIVASGIWTVGLCSWLGIELSNMVSLTFMLIVAVGIADCVHVLSTYLFYRHENQDHHSAIKHAYRKTGMPIFLTTITTMAGMSALIFTDIPQIAVFGVASALGVFMAFVLTLFILPVCLDIWHPYNENGQAQTDDGPSSGHWLQALLNKIPTLVGKAPKLIVLCYLVIFIVFAYGTSQTKIDSNFAELTREGSSIRVTAELIDNHMMGGQNLEVMLDFGKADALKDPLVLKSIEKLQKHVLNNYTRFVVKSFSLSDFVKDTHQVMQQNNPDFHVIPDSATLTAQLLYLFDNANPEDRRMLVSDDYSQTHVSFQLKNAGSYEYTAFFNSVRKDIKTIFNPVAANYPNSHQSVTGALPLMMELIDHISWTQVKSFSIALVIITILMTITLGSIQAGMISMIPNLLPAFFTFGFMGLLSIPLDTDTLIIAPLIIGIAVDDTIHFMAHYRAAWFAHGDVDKALRETIKEVGQAVTFTTLILGVGFSTLAFSDYLGLAKTGIFGSMAIFVALTSDILLLPAIIKWFKPDLGRRRYLKTGATTQPVEG